MWQWLKNNSEALSAIGSLATAVALLLAYFSFRNTERAVEANLMYQVQSDAREISEKLFGDNAVRNYILAENTNETFSDETVSKAQGLLHELVRFYAAIERLQTYDYIENTYWENTKEDICDLMRYPHFRQFWSKNIEPKGAQFREKFKNTAKQCKN